MWKVLSINMYRNGVIYDDDTLLRCSQPATLIFWFEQSERGNTENFAEQNL